MIGKMPFHIRHDVMQFSLGSMIILRCIVVLVLLAVGYLLFARVHHLFPRHWHHLIHMHWFTLLRFDSFATYFEWRFCFRNFLFFFCAWFSFFWGFSFVFFFKKSFCCSFNWQSMEQWVKQTHNGKNIKLKLNQSKWKSIQTLKM